MDSFVVCERWPPDRHQRNLCTAVCDTVFREYYQIGRGCKSLDTESEPRKEGELKTVYEQSHSPFGFIWQIASETGWSVDYILHKVNYQTLLMMMMDAPRYVKKSPDESNALSEEEEEEQMFNYFQSQF